MSGVDASDRARGIPSSRWPRPAFIRPSRRRFSPWREDPGKSGLAGRWPRQREFGPTDAHKVLFSPEDTGRREARPVRWLRRGESNRRVAMLRRRRMVHTIPPRKRSQTTTNRGEPDVATSTVFPLPTFGFSEASRRCPMGAQKTTS